MFNKLLAKAQRRPTGTKGARVFSMPAPVEGLNKNSALTDMKISEGLVLDNIICGKGSVRVRPGTSSTLNTHVSTSSAIIPSNSNANVMFIPRDGAVHAQQITGGTVAQFSDAAFLGACDWAFFSTVGGTFMFFVSTAGIWSWEPFAGAANRSNGAGGDDITLSGIPVTGLDGVMAHAERLWFWGKGYPDDLTAYYLPTASVAGALTAFPMGSLFNKGGQIITIASWTRDGGDGMDDYLCVFTNKGEVLIFQGTNPASIDDWQKVGCYDIGRMPTEQTRIAKRCVTKVGGDLGVITHRGIAMLSELSQTNESGEEKIAITYKVSGLYSDIMRNYTLNTNDHLFQLTEYAEENLLIVNYPRPDNSQAGQLVLNVATGAWSRWTGLDAKAWGVGVNGEVLFMTQANAVRILDSAYLSDGGTGIAWRIQSSFTTLKTALNKVVGAVRLYMTAPPGYMPVIEVKTDYDGRDFDSASGTRTDAGLSVSSATVTATPQAIWASVPAEGTAFSLCLSGTVSNSTLEFNAADFLFEQADIL